jgi:hypothetical protein
MGGKRRGVSTWTTTTSETTETTTTGTPRPVRAKALAAGRQPNPPVSRSQIGACAARITRERTR